MAILRLTEWLYPIFAVLFAYKAYIAYGEDDGYFWLYVGLVGLALGMFAFRRYYRKKFDRYRAEREQQNQDQ